MRVTLQRDDATLTDAHADETIARDRRRSARPASERSCAGDAGWPDVVIVGITIVFAFKGFKKGFVSELAGAVALFVAIIAAFRYDGALDGIATSLTGLDARLGARRRLVDLRDRRLRDRHAGRVAARPDREACR